MALTDRVLHFYLCLLLLIICMSLINCQKQGGKQKLQGDELKKPTYRPRKHPNSGHVKTSEHSRDQVKSKYLEPKLKPMTNFKYQHHTPSHLRTPERTETTTLRYISEEDDVHKDLPVINWGDTPKYVKLDTNSDHLLYTPPHLRAPEKTEATTLRYIPEEDGVHQDVPVIEVGDTPKNVDINTNLDHLLYALQNLRAPEKTETTTPRYISKENDVHKDLPVINWGDTPKYVDLDTNSDHSLYTPPHLSAPEKTEATTPRYIPEEDDVNKDFPAIDLGDTPNNIDLNTNSDFSTVPNLRAPEKTETTTPRYIPVEDDVNKDLPVIDLGDTSNNMDLSTNSDHLLYTPSHWRAPEKTETATLRYISEEDDVHKDLPVIEWGNASKAEEPIEITTISNTPKDVVPNIDLNYLLYTPSHWRVPEKTETTTSRYIPGEDDVNKDLPVIDLDDTPDHVDLNTNSDLLLSTAPHWRDPEKTETTTSRYISEEDDVHKDLPVIDWGNASKAEEPIEITTISNTPKDVDPNIDLGYLLYTPSHWRAPEKTETTTSRYIPGEDDVNTDLPVIDLVDTPNNVDLNTNSNFLLSTAPHWRAPEKTETTTSRYISEEDDVHKDLPFIDWGNVVEAEEPIEITTISNTPKDVYPNIDLDYLLYTPSHWRAPEKTETTTSRYIPGENDVNTDLPVIDLGDTSNNMDLNTNSNLLLSTSPYWRAPEKTETTTSRYIPGEDDVNTDVPVIDLVDTPNNVDLNTNSNLLLSTAPHWRAPEKTETTTSRYISEEDDVHKDLPVIDWGNAVKTEDPIEITTISNTPKDVDPNIDLDYLLYTPPHWRTTERTKITTPKYLSEEDDIHKDLPVIDWGNAVKIEEPIVLTTISNTPKDVDPNIDSDYLLHHIHHIHHFHHSITPPHLRTTERTNIKIPKYLSVEDDMHKDLSVIDWGDTVKAEKPIEVTTISNTATPKTKPVQTRVNDSKSTSENGYSESTTLTTQRSNDNLLQPVQQNGEHGVQFPIIDDSAFSLCGRGPSPKEMIIPSDEEESNDFSEPIENVPIEEGSENKLLLHILELQNEQSDHHGQFEVTNSDSANPVAWPWMTAIFRRSNFNVSTYWCGGSIIDRSTILTAAHCFHHLNASEYFVRIGDYDLSTENDGRVPETLEIDRIIIHENYTEGKYYDDIAILKLKTSIVYKNHISPVCLPSPDNENYTGVDGYIIGWGDTSFAGRSSDILQQATIPLITNKDCDNRFQELKSYKNIFPDGVSQSFVCADFGERNQDACQGDSGGPLMRYNVGWDIIGIVSFGVGCNREGFSGVYTRVDQYLDWIDLNKL